MVDETSRLNVEVDGSTAIADTDRIASAFRRLENAVSRTSAAFGRFARSGGSALSSFRSVATSVASSVTSAFNALRSTIRLFTRTFTTMLKWITAAAAAFSLFTRSVAGTGNQINKFVNTLVILTGNTTDATERLGQLFEMSNRLGASFTAAATPFTKFAAAAAGTLSDPAILKVFESFATVGVALQLTQSEVTGVFLALQQIASKGVVSMEELRLQLAERVPGAMRLAASSMNMTMADFEKAVQKRTIDAGQFLENFAQKLKETYGDAAQIASQRLFADIQRLGNAFVAFKQKVFGSGFEEGLRTLVQSAIHFLNDNPALAQALGQFSKGIFEKVADFIDKLSPQRVVGILNTVIGAIEALINALRTLAFWIRRAFDEGFKDSIKEVEGYTRQLNKYIAARNAEVEKLKSGRVIENNFLTRDVNRPMTPAEIYGSERKIAKLDQLILMAKDALVGARIEARNLGIELEDLPENPLQTITDSLGPQKIKLPRIEIQPSSIGLDLSNQPNIDFGTTAALQDALEQAERVSTIEMPKFYDKLLSGEIRSAMAELDVVTLDYNVATEAQAMLLDKIKTKHQELEALRNQDESVVKAEDLNQRTKELTQLTNEYLAAEEKRNELKQKQLELMDQEESRLNSLTSFQKNLEETFTSTQDAIFNSIKKTEDALVDLVKTGKLNFKELADSIIADLSRMAIQAFLTRYVIGPLLGGASVAFGNALGGTFSTPYTAPNPVGTPSGGGFHTGGIVDDKFAKMSLSEKMKDNERIIKVQKGEGVFTPDQMGAMASLADVSSIVRASLPTVPMSPVARPVVNVAPSQTKVEVINNTGEEATVEKSIQPDGTELHRIIVGAVSSDIAKGGDISKLLKGRYGLRTTTGKR